MNYDTMGAGREMDALVAEKVMGWKGSRKDHPLTGEKDGAWLWGDGALVGIPYYSESISAAWEVVEKANLFDNYCLGKCSDGDFGVFLNDDEGGEAVIAFAPTAPLAICRASLKSVGEKEG